MFVGAPRSGALAKVHEVEARSSTSDPDIRDRQFLGPHEGVHIYAGSLRAQALHNRYDFRDRSRIRALTSNQWGGFARR